MADRYANRVVWITGGGTGLGRALAIELSAQGATVVVSGRRADRLDETVALLPRAGLAIAGDVTDDGSLSSTVDTIIAQYGKLDVVVANAGYAAAGSVLDLDREAWTRQFDVNVVGAAMTAKFSIPHLAATKGRLVLIGSVAAWTPMPLNAPYVASKAAVLGLGRTLHAELVDQGISCTTIQPGFVESEIAKVDNDGVFHGDRTDKRPSKLMWKAEDAARAMAAAIDRRKVEFTFTMHGKAAAFLGRHLPGLVQYAVTKVEM